MIDGIPSRLGQKPIFIYVLKQEIDISLLIALFHCIIHVENMHAQFSEVDFIKSVTDKIVKIIQ